MTQQVIGAAGAGTDYAAPERTFEFGLQTLLGGLAAGLMEPPPASRPER